MWYIVNPNQLNCINSQDFIRGVHGLALNFSDKSINKLFQVFSEGEKEISQDQFFNKLTTFKPLLAVTIEEIAKPIEYLSIALMSNNLSLLNYQDLIMKKSEFTYKQFYNMLAQDFQGIGNDSIDLICRAIFGDFYTLEAKEICRILEKIIVKFDHFDKETDSFHELLKEFFCNKGNLFLIKCEELDKDYVGRISFDSF